MGSVLSKIPTVIETREIRQNFHSYRNFQKSENEGSKSDGGVPISVGSQSLNIRSLSGTSRCLQVYCTPGVLVLMLQLQPIIPLPVFSPAVFSKAFQAKCRKNGSCFVSLCHVFASPNNDAISTANKFQISTINEGYSISRHEPDFQPKTKT